MEFEFEDRYEALGMKYPDPKTMCRGQCDGTGWVPLCQDDLDPEFENLWQEAHDKAHTFNAWAEAIWLFIKMKEWRLVWQCILDGYRECDGWHFIKCPTCGGSGKHETNRI